MKGLNVPDISEIRKKIYGPKRFVSLEQASCRNNVWGGRIGTRHWSLKFLSSIYIFIFIICSLKYSDIISIVYFKAS